MKRPLALVGFTYLLTQAVSVFLGGTAGFLLGAACLLLGLLLLLPRCSAAGKSRVLAAAAFTAAAACLLGGLARLPLTQAAQQNVGKTVTLTGVVTEEPDFSTGKAQYTLRVETCGGKTDSTLCGKKIRFTAGEDFSAEQFDRVTGTVRLFAPTAAGFFSKKNRLLAEGVVLEGYLYDFRPFTAEAAQPSLWQEVPYRIRQSLLEQFSLHLPSPEDSLVSGVLVGERQAIPDAVNRAFRSAGISHLLSVSGLHMATVAQMLLLLLALLPLPRRVRHLLACGGVLLFMGITCFVPSVLRSGIMYLVLLCGNCFYRKADGLNLLGLSMLLLCLANPYAAADLSLQLSFAATLGLLLCTGPLERWFRQRVGVRGVRRRLLHLLFGTAATSLSATLFTLPVSLLVFDELSLVSPLANLLVLTPSGWMIYAGFGAAFTGPFPVLHNVSTLLWQVTAALARWLIDSAAWCASLPFASVPTGYRFVQLWLACTLLLLGVGCLLCRRHRRLPLRLTAALSAVLFLLNLLVYETGANALKITVAASGEGVSAVVSYAGRGVVIGFGADSWQTERILRRCGVAKLDTAVVLSLSNRECQQAAAVLTDWHADHVILPGGTVLDGALEQALSHVGSCTVAGTQAQVSLWQRSVLLTFANGAAHLQAEGLSVLFCGEDADLADAPAGLLNAQVLVCGDLPKREEMLQTALTVLCRYPNSLKSYAESRRGLPSVLGGGQDLVLQPQSGAVRIRRND